MLYVKITKLPNNAVLTTIRDDTMRAALMNERIVNFAPTILSHFRSYQVKCGNINRLILLLR